MVSTCPFCAIVEGEDTNVREVVRNDSVVVFFPTEPAVLGHCLVIPKRHTEIFTELTDEEVTQVMLAAQKVAGSIRGTLKPDGINIIQSNGESATQTVLHVHVHVLPRWDGDQVENFWPLETNYSSDDKDRVLARLRASTFLPNDVVDPEDRRQHLAFVQNVISRMSQSSSNAKSWLLPVVMSAYGYGATKPSVAVALLGVFATIVFGILDIGYLYTERKYRELYERIVTGDVEVDTYSLNYKRSSDTWKSRFYDHCKVMATWTVWPFYGAFLLTGLVALIVAAYSG